VRPKFRGRATTAELVPDPACFSSCTEFTRSEQAGSDKTKEEACDRLRRTSQTENTEPAVVAQRIVDDAVRRARDRRNQRGCVSHRCARSKRLAHPVCSSARSRLRIPDSQQPRIPKILIANRIHHCITSCEWSKLPHKLRLLVRSVNRYCGSVIEPTAAVDEVSPLRSDTVRRMRWSILAVVSAAAFMANLDLFIVNIAVPAISDSFPSATLGEISWVLNAYTVVFAAGLVPAGRLADHFGRRRFLLVGVTLFVAASVLCGIAPALWVLVAGRTLQALGAALIVPASLGLVTAVFPRSQHRTVVGIWAGVAAVAGSAGPVVGGLLVAIDWRWIFFVNVPIGAAVVAVAWRILPTQPIDRHAQLPDVMSILSMFAAIALVIVAVVQGISWGWTSAPEVTTWIAAALSSGVALWRIVTHPRAVIEWPLFRVAEFSAASAALFVYYMAFAAWLLTNVLFFQQVWHYSATTSGLAIAPGPITSAVFLMGSRVIDRRLGRHVPAVLGPLLFTAAAVYWLIATDSTPNYVWGFLPGLILAGIGNGLTQPPLFAAAGSLPENRSTTGSAMLNMARQTGSALGVALIIAIINTDHPDTLNQFHRGW
jgi:EmrB/QacA subfamily drug resistance transporter